MKVSLPIRILFATLIIFALPLLIYFLVVFYQSFNMRYEEVVVQLEHLGENRALLLSQSERFSIRMTGVIEQLIAGEDLSHKELDSLFERVTKGGDFHSVFLIQKQPDGRYLAVASSDVEIIGEDFSGQNLIEAAEVKGRTSFLDFDETSFSRLLWVVSRIPQGILVITTPVTNLLNRLISGGPEPYAVNFS